MSSVLFVASEGLPFIKSGGLADVIGSLPKELVRKGDDARVIMPLYLKIVNQHKENLEKLCTFDVHSGNLHTVATIYTTVREGVTYYFVEHQGYFERGGLYGYDDDGERFAFFTKAVLEMLNQIDYFPDIVHCHDWHTGMLALMCKDHYAHDARYQNMKHVMTIHNLAFQGNFSADLLHTCLGMDMKYYFDGTVRFHNGISYLKAGILFSDKVTTVSNTYAHEILTKEFGENMEGVLESRAWDLSGIVNGIDCDLWNPKTDSLLAKNYDVKSFVGGKKANKRALQEAMGLRVADDVLLIGMVSRLTWQKGVYLLVEKMYELMGQDVQLVILGTGETNIENEFKQIEYRFPRRAVYYCGYNEELAHQIYAGCDAFLMPSLFEPCGLSQLISMRYGTLPIVRETGGLKDTVVPYNQYTKEGTGFTFANFNADEMMNMIKYCIYVYYMQKEDWKTLVTNAMKADVSWEASCRKYFELYDSIL